MGNKTKNNAYEDKLTELTNRLIEEKSHEEILEFIKIVEEEFSNCPQRVREEVINYMKLVLRISKVKNKRVA